MSYHDYLNSPPDVVQAMILEALQSIDEKLGHLLQGASLCVGATPDAPVTPSPAEVEPAKTWRVRGQSLGPEAFASREEVDALVNSWHDPMFARAFTHVYVGRQVEGAEEVEPGL